MLFESLETRLQLAGDFDGFDRLLRVDTTDTFLQLVERSDPNQVVLQSPLASADTFHVPSTELGDRLEIDFSRPFIYGGPISIEAMDGEDSVHLVGRSLEHLDWTDHADGASTVFIAGNQFTISGLETFRVDGAVDRLTLRGSAASDHYQLQSGPAGELFIDDINGTLITLTTPGETIDIRGNDGNDRIAADGLALIGTNLLLSGDGGADTLAITNSQFSQSDLSLIAGPDDDTIEVRDNLVFQGDVTLLGGFDSDVLTVHRTELVNATGLVNGNSGDDVIRLGGDALTGWALDGSADSDTLNSDFLTTDWALTGIGIGTINQVPFSGFENLSGAPAQIDRFEIYPNAGVTGVIDGGSGSSDELHVYDHGAGPQTLHHFVTGPQAGLFRNEASSVHHQHLGFESVRFETESTSQTIELSDGANVTLTQSDDGSLVTDIQYAFDALTDLTQLDGSDGTIIVSSSNENLGQSAHSAGDINGDGIDDAIFGAPDQDIAYVIYGVAGGLDPTTSVDELDGSNGFVLRGPSGENVGFSVSGGGDINADGFDDVVVSAPGPTAAPSAGTSYVIFGKDAFEASIDLSTLDGSDGFALTGAAAGDASGYSVDLVTDFNGDMISDVVIGAPGADPNGLTDAGQAYVFFGSNKAFPPGISLADVNGMNGVVLNGEAAGDALGFSVADAGDLNSDETSDLALGAPGGDGNGSDSGTAYVFFGAADFAVANGLQAAFYETGVVSSLADANAAIAGSLPDATFDAYSADYPNTDDIDTVDSSTALSEFLGLNAENINGDTSATIGGTTFTFDGFLYVDQPGTFNFEVGSSGGFSLAIDGTPIASFDGPRDFATTSGSYTFAKQGFYPVSLLYFTAEGTSGVEFKSDLSGEMELVTRERLFSSPAIRSYELASLDGNSGLAIHGSAAGDALGTAVGRAGDVNGDGVTELIVGAPGSDVGGTDSGQAYLLFGKPITSIDEGFSATYSASTLQDDEGLTLSGSVAGAGTGTAVSSVGDLNDDGFFDVALGAPGGTNLPGQVHVVFGSATLGDSGGIDLETLDGVTGFTATAGKFGDELGASVSGDLDFDGDGISDLMAGAPASSLSSGGRGYVIAGRYAGGVGTSVSYALPDSSFVLDGESADARITLGTPSSDTAPPNSADPSDDNLLNFDGSDVEVKGRLITITADQPVSSRKIADDGDPATSISTGDSGHIRLSASYSGSYGKEAAVHLENNSVIYAQVEESSTFKPGDIRISAESVITSTTIPVFDLLEEGVRNATVSIEQGVNVFGGDIDITTNAGIQDIDELMKASAVGIGGIAVEKLGEKYAELLDLPVSVQVSTVKSTIDIGKTNDSTTGSTDVQIIGSGNVGIEADAHAEAKGNAVFWINPKSPGSSWGLAFGLWIANATSKVTLEDGVTVQSTEGNVSIAADSTVNAGGDARVSQNLTQGLSSSDNKIPANPNNVALAIGLAITDTTAKVFVKQGATVIADLGNVAVTADGEDSVKIHPETRSYQDGRYGVSFGFQDSTDDIRAVVDGSVRAAGTQAANRIQFDPFTAVDTENDTIDLGSEHGYSTGDTIEYSPGLGGVIDGLERLVKYNVIVDENNPNLIQLSASGDLQGDSGVIDLRDSPTLYSPSADRTLPFTYIGSENNWIDFGFDHGFSDGEALTYSAAGNKRVGGLSDATSYYAVLVDGQPNLLKLAATSDATSTIDLDTDITFTNSTNNILVVESVEEGPAVITFTEEHNLSAGDAITYSPALGFRLLNDFSGELYPDGTIFYAIPSPSETDPETTDPTKIRLAVSAEEATNSNGYTNAIDIAIDQSFMAGTEHQITPKSGSGITISATMLGTHSSESKARIGGSESLTKTWTRPEFTKAATKFRSELYGSINDEQLADPQNNNGVDGMDVNTDQDFIDLSAAIIYQTIDRTVEAVVGSHAIIKSGTDLNVQARAEETGNIIVEAGATQSVKQGIKIATGASVNLATYTTSVIAVANSGSTLDASGELGIEAENVRSFPVSVDSGEAFADSLLEEFEQNPAAFVGDLNKTLLHPLFTTAWTYTRVAPAQADDSVGAAFQYAHYNNHTKAIIADNVLVNQDESYRTDEQNVVVDAYIEMHLVNMAGVAELGLQPSKAVGAVVALLDKDRDLEKGSSPLPEAGVEGKDVAIGTSLNWTDVNNTTVARIGGPSPLDDSGDAAAPPETSASPPIVHTGADGEGLKVQADEELWYFGFVDTSAKTESGKFAFAGAGSLFRHNQQFGEVTASIASGSQITGGKIDLDALDNLVLVGQNGSFISGDNTRSVGVGVNYWDVSRNVRSYIGDFDGVSTSATDIHLADGSSIDVHAESDGFAIAFALASTLRTNGEDLGNQSGVVDPPNPEEPNENDPVGDGANPGASGWSLAADVNYVNLRSDQVLAFIDDAGTVIADDVTIEAVNKNSYVGLAGAFAVTTTDFDPSSNSGLAGSFSGIGLSRGTPDSLGRGDSDTFAYIRRANVQTGSLELTASRAGKYISNAAGGAGEARGAGLEAAGSAAWNSLQYATRAFVDEDAMLMLDNDSLIKASDRVSAMAFAGDVVWGGSIGFGTSWAWNNVDRQVHALVNDSDIQQSSGSLSIDARIWDVNTSGGKTAAPNGYAVAATLGRSSETPVELGGTVAVNQFNVDTSADAVSAKIGDGSSYTSTDTTSQAGLSLSAVDKSNQLAIAGGVGLGGKFTLDVAAAVNELDHQINASVEDATVEMKAGDVAINANLQPEMNAFGLGAAISSTETGGVVAGSGAANRSKASSAAWVRGTVDNGLTDTSISGADDITVSSNLKFVDVASGAGAFGVQTGTDSASLGAAVAVNDLSGVSNTASIDEATLAANSDIVVDATTEMVEGGVIQSISVGLDYAADFSLGGSVSENTVTPTTEASITGSTSELTAGGDVSLSSAEKGLVVSAGSGLVSDAFAQAGGSAYGASVATNVVHSRANAFVQDATLSAAGNANVSASRNNAQVVAVGVGGVNAANFALGGSVVTNDVLHHIDAHVSDGGTVAGDSGVSVQALEDSPVIVAAAGNYSAAGKGAAVGAAIPTNQIDRDLRAYVGNLDRDSFASGADGAAATSNSGQIEISAKRKDSLTLAVGVGGVAADTFSLGGSAATNSIEVSVVDAHAWGATLEGDQGVVIDAKDTQATNVAGAGNLDLSYLFQTISAPDNNAALSAEPTLVDGLAYVEEAGGDAVLEQVASQQTDLQQQSFATLESLISTIDPIDVAQYGIATSVNDFIAFLDSVIDDSDAPTPTIIGPIRDGSANDSANTPLGAGVAASVGIALANNLALDPTVIAFASDATVESTSGDVSIAAKQDALFVTIAGSGSISKSGVTLDATEATTEYTPTTKAYVDSADKDSTVNANGNVIVDVDTNLHAVTVAGNVAFNATGSSVAFTVATLKHTDTTESYLDNVGVTLAANGADVSVPTGIDLEKDTNDAFQGVSVTATSNDVITTVAAGTDVATGGSSSNRAASVAVNLLDETTTAKLHPNSSINQDTSGLTVDSDLEVNVFAWNQTTGHSGGGAIGLSGGDTWGIGASSDSGNITKSTIASLESSVVNASDNVSVQSLSDEKIASYEGTVAISKSTEIAASAGVYIFDLTTEASVGTSDNSSATKLDTDGSVLIAADDVTRTDIFAGSLAIALGNESASVGASFGMVHLSKHTSATIQEMATVDAKGLSAKNALSAAESGFDVSFAAGDGDTSEVQPPGLQTTNTLDDSADASAPVDDQAYTQVRSVTPQLNAMRGIAVTATGRDVVKGMTFSGAVGQEIAVGTAGLVRTGTTNTTATINGNATADSLVESDANQDVLVSASHDYHQLSVTGGVAISPGSNSIASATPGLVWAVTNLNTSALIGAGATVTSSSDTTVSASGSEHITVVSVGFAESGTAAIDLQVGLSKLTNAVTAQIGSGATVNAEGNVLVDAEDNTHVTQVVGGAAIAISLKSAGLGASFGYLDVGKTTSATIEDSAIVDGRGNSVDSMDVIDGGVSKTGDFPTKAIHGVAVQSRSNETVQSYAISGDAGLYAGIGGGLLYSHVHSDTDASIGDSAQINQAAGTPSSNQSVAIGASNDAQISNLAGGLAAGFVALAGAFDIGILRNNTTARVDENAAISALKDIDVHSVSRGNTNSTAFNTGDGAIGLTGTGSVWTLGKKLESTYNTVSSTVDALQVQSGNNPSPQYNSFSEYGDAQANRSDVSDSLSQYDADANSPEGNQLAANIADAASDQMVSATPMGEVSSAVASDSTGGTTAEILTSGSGTGIVAGGQISVTSAERTDLDVHLGTVDVDAVSFGASVGVAQVRGGAVANVDGRLQAGGDILVTADSSSDLYGNALFGAVSIANVGAAVVDFEDHSLQQASLGDGAEIVAAEDVTISATRTYDQFKTESIEFAAGIAVAGASVAQSKVFGSTSAYAGDVDISKDRAGLLGAAPTVGNVTITARSDSDPVAVAGAGSLGVFGGDGNRADAVVKPTVDAHFGSGSGGTAYLTGDLQVTANSSALPDAEGHGVSVSELGIEVGVSQTTATASPTVNSYIADNATISLGMESVAIANAGFEDFVLQDGQFTTPTGGIADPDPIPGWILGSGTAGTMNPTTSQFPAEAPEGQNVALSNGATFSQAVSEVLTADTYYELYVDVGFRLDVTDDPSYQIQLLAGDTVIAEDDSSLQPASGTFEASFLTYKAGADDPNLGETLTIAIRSLQAQSNFDNVRLFQSSDRGELKVVANTAEDPTSHGRSSGGGVFTGLGVDTNANIEPVTKAWIGAGVQIDSVNDVITQATDQWVGTSTASGDDIGFVTVSENDASITVQPDVSAYINADSITSHFGAVTVEALSGEAGTLPELTFDVEHIDFQNNIINFDLPHGLEDGDTVIYDPQDGAVVGGLEDGGAYLVERLSSTAIRFVYKFDSADVDPETSQIYADQPHGIETGAPVIYDANGTDAIANLTDGGSYFVSANDPHHLRVADSQVVADNLYETPFKIDGNIDESNNEIQLNILLQGTSHSGHSAGGDEHITLDTAPGWSDGTAIYYFPIGSDNITELDFDRRYYVYEGDKTTHYHVTKTHGDAINNTNPIKFSHTRDGSFVTDQTNTWYAASEGLNTPQNQFSTSDLDFTNNTITFTSTPAFGDGDIVGLQYVSGTGDSFGLSESLYYYANVTHVEGNTVVKLSLKSTSGPFIEFQAPVNLNTVWALTSPFDVKTGDPLTYRAPLQIHFSSADLQDGKIVIDLAEAPTLFRDFVEYDDVGDNNDEPYITYDIVSTFPNATPIDGLDIGAEYYLDVKQTSDVELTITVLGVTLGSSEDPDTGTPVDHILRMKGHGPADGLEDENTYYMIVDSSTPGLIKIAATEQDAHNGTAIAIGTQPHITLSGKNTDIIDVDYDADKLTINGSGFKTGDLISYHTIQGKWIIGLTGGSSYYVISPGTSSKTIQLATTLADAQNGIARDLSLAPRFVGSDSVAHAFSVDEYSNTIHFFNETGIQTGDALTYQGVFGLPIVDLRVDETYYAIVPDPDDTTTIQLATSYDRAFNSLSYDADGKVAVSNAIYFYVAQDIIPGDEGGTHLLGIEGIGIAPPSGTTGIQSLVIDLYSSGTSGTQGFLQAGPTESVSGTPTVKAEGINGDIVGGIGTHAKASIKPNVTAFVGDPAGPEAPAAISIDATDFVLSSTSDTYVKAESIGYDISVGAGGGAAFATVNIFNTADTYVGSGAEINVSGNSWISAVSSESADAKTDMLAGGAVDVAQTDADVNIGRATSVTFGSGTSSSATSINAAGNNTVSSTSLTNAIANGKAHAYGAVAIAVPDVDISVGHGNYPASTELNIGDHTTFTGDTLILNVFADHSNIKSEATAKTGDLFGGSTVDAETVIDDHAKLLIGQNVSSSTTHPKSVNARVSYVSEDPNSPDYQTGNVVATSNAHSRTLVGGDHATAKTEITGGVTLDGQFADSVDDYTNYNAQVTKPTHLKEYHKSKTYYLWFINDHHSGGSPSYSADVDIEQNPATTIPSALEEGTRFEAENFDIGGEGVAYHDSSAGNSGNQYRLNESVDIYASSDFDGGFVVGGIRTGEHLDFTVDVAPGTYNLTARVASNRGDKSFGEEVGQVIVKVGDGTNFTTVGTFSVLHTGGWQTWDNATLSEITLAGGEGQVLRLEMSSPENANTDLFNLNWIQLGRAAIGTAPIAIGEGTTRIEVENFDLGGEGIAYHDSSTGNAGKQYRQQEDVDIQVTHDSSGDFNLYNINKNEYVDFTVDITGGLYDVHFRAASRREIVPGVSVGEVHIQVGDGTNFTTVGTATLRSTSDYQTWSTQSTRRIGLPDGDGQILRLSFAGVNGLTDQLFNLNWVAFEKVSQGPYIAPHLINNSGDRIQAEEFDRGGQGFAYSDTTPGNQGGSTFRSNEEVDVDIDNSEDVGFGFEIVNIVDGEYLEYTVNVSEGVYDFVARVSSNRAVGEGAEVGTITIKLGDGNDFTTLGTLSVKKTDGWKNFKLQATDGLQLEAGTNQFLRLEFNDAEASQDDLFDLNWFQFAPRSTGCTQHNDLVANDVDNSGTVTPFDALLVINLLERADAAEVPNQFCAGQELRYYDTSNDGRVTSMDALRIINALSVVTAEPESLRSETDLLEPGSAFPSAPAPLLGRVAESETSTNTTQATDHVLSEISPQRWTAWVDSTDATPGFAGTEARVPQATTEKMAEGTRPNDELLELLAKQEKGVKTRF